MHSFCDSILLSPSQPSVNQHLLIHSCKTSPLPPLTLPKKLKQDTTTLNTSIKTIFNFEENKVDLYLNKRKEESSLFVDKQPEKSLSDSPLRTERELERKIIKKAKPGGFKYLLNHVYFSLADIFNGKNIDICQYELKPEEASLVKLIIEKKLGKNVKKSFMDKFCPYNEMDLASIKKLLDTKPVKKKRKDEQLKFIFNLIMKHAKNKYIAENPDEKDFSEKDFLSFYFKEQSEKKGIDLLCFGNPIDSNINNPRYKYFSTEYLELLFSSQRFREFSLNFIQNRLERDYKVMVWKKFYNIFSKLRVELRNIPEDKKEEIIRTYIEKSQKRKFVFPWTCWEVKEAIEKFSKQLKKFNDQ